MSEHRTTSYMQESPKPKGASSQNALDEAPDGSHIAPIADFESRFRSLALAALEKERIERGQLARTLHDEVAQILSGAGLQLDILRMDLEERVPQIVSRTAEIQDLLEQVVRRIRERSYELNPDSVERAGLQPALDLLVGRYRKGFAGGLRLIYDSSVRIPPGAGVAFERIAEEALANAVKHAQCGQIEIIVKATRLGPTLQVRDDGVGFDYEQERRTPHGLGLLTMQYCAERAGLRLLVGKSGTRGMTVRALAMKQREDSQRQSKQKPR